MKNQGRKGSVLLYVIMIFCLMTVLGTGLVFLANHNTKMTKIEMNAEQAYQSALSGLETTLDAFVKEPEVGQNIVNAIRQGTPTLSSQIPADGMGNINIVVSCAPGEDQSTCKKLEVNSTAIYEGLSKHVVGYLNIIEGGGPENPIVVSDEYTYEGNPGNTTFCLFPDDAGNRECANSKNEYTFQKIDNPINENEYNKFISDKIASINSNCSGSPIKSNCKKSYYQGEIVNLKIDNSKGNIFINIDSSRGIRLDFLIEVSDPKSENIVVLLVNPVSIDNSSIGSNEESADNIVLMAKEAGAFNLSTNGGSVNFNAWLINPFGAVETIGSNHHRVNVNGGVFSQEFKFGKFTSVNGVRPNDAMLSIFAEAGLSFGGGSGGAMSFGKTYDK